MSKMSTSSMVLWLQCLVTHGVVTVQEAVLHIQTSQLLLSRDERQCLISSSDFFKGPVNWILWSNEINLYIFLDYIYIYMMYLLIYVYIYL